MQFIKAKANGTNFYKFAPKRLVILFAIGMLHAFFIWWGDILATYAFCGVFLLAFIRLPAKWLLTIALVVNALYQFLFISSYKLGGFFDEPTSSLSVDLTAIENAITAYGIGGWMDTFHQRLADLAIQMSAIMWVSSLFTILPYMLIGAAFAGWIAFLWGDSIMTFYLSY